MKITIEAVQNGFILIDNTEDNTKKFVFHKDEDSFDESLNTEINLLYAIADLLFESKNKYSAHRLYIKDFPGHSYEGDLTQQQKEDFELIKSICEREENSE